jgi:hypothetical protein
MKKKQTIERSKFERGIEMKDKKKDKKEREKKKKEESGTYKLC